MAGTEARVCKVGRERGTTVMTVNDCVEMGIEASVERALEVAWDGTSAVWLSFDVDCLDAAFVPGTGWPEPGGFLPREALALVRGIASRGLAGMEVVECSPRTTRRTSRRSSGSRVICDVLATPGPLRPSRRSADGRTRDGRARTRGRRCG